MEKGIDRRTVLQTGLAAAVGASVKAGMRAGEAVAATSTPSLRDRFFGCVAGVYVGSSMGAAVEGWSWERIEKEHGTLDRLLPYQHYRATSEWVREPGTTEDGVDGRSSSPSRSSPSGIGSPPRTCGAPGWST